MTEEGEGDDRLKIAVLYFLTSVIAGKRKQTTKIDDFLVNIVDDLPLCRRFPWGSYTFKNCVAKIRNYVENQKGIPNPSFCFEGFYLGLERLAFESIPSLKNSHLKDVAEANNACPRMCKSHFVDYDLRGFPLERIYNHLGETKEIQSILEPEADEQHLVANIVENADYVDRRVTWNAALRDNQVVCWEDLYDRDVSNREIEMRTKENDKEAQVGRRGQVQKAVPRKKDDRYMNRLKRQLYRRIDQRVAEVGKSRLNPSQSSEVAVEALVPNGARATDAENNDDMNQEEHREHEEEDAPHMTQEATPNDPSEHEEEDVDNGNYFEFEESQPQSSPFQTEEIANLKESKKKAEKPLPPSQVVNEPFKCNLINHNGNNDVVAIGCCYPSRVFLHNVPLKPDEVVVTVSEVKIDIRLWETVDDIEMLRNAIGQFIVWPKKMVLHYEEEKSEDQIERNSNTEQQMDENGRELTGTDEEEQRVQTGSGGNGSEDVPVAKKLRVYVRRKRNPPRTGNPGKSRYGRPYVNTIRFTPSAYK
ncbi:hypothetical protein DY000_02000631 [Brassica cretica]|uniref:DUF1985 domain-containing protein n=1 Tax=Brassica cretica TaxID=69181 RepID=A0ABQ7BUF8_BRACR|nr:hypothetical protein DY000_02000631 [Brassica cretica]